jgi:hypothetical protein
MDNVQKTNTVRNHLICIRQVTITGFCVNCMKVRSVLPNGVTVDLLELHKGKWLNRLQKQIMKMCGIAERHIYVHLIKRCKLWPVCYRRRSPPPIFPFCSRLIASHCYTSNYLFLVICRVAYSPGTQLTC